MSRLSPELAELSIPQLQAHAKQKDLSARMTLRAAARLQSEADAIRKEIKRRRREEKASRA